MNQNPWLFGGQEFRTDRDAAFPVKNNYICISHTQPDSISKSASTWAFLNRPKMFIINLKAILKAAQHLLQISSKQRVRFYRQCKPEESKLIDPIWETKSAKFGPSMWLSDVLKMLLDTPGK